MCSVPPESTQKRGITPSGKLHGGSFGNDSQTRPSLMEARHLSRASGNGKLSLGNHAELGSVAED